jgi:hypothetical protein
VQDLEILKRQREPFKIEGWVKKASHGTVKQWQKRFVVCDPSTRQLQYFHGPDEAKGIPRKSIFLDRVESVRLSHGYRNRVELSVLAEQGALELEFENNRDALVWTRSICNVIATVPSTMSPLTTITHAAGAMATTTHLNVFTAADAEESAMTPSGSPSLTSSPRVAMFDSRVAQNTVVLSANLKIKSSNAVGRVCMLITFQL